MRCLPAGWRCGRRLSEEAVMVEVLEIALGVMLGLGLIGGVFWLAFRGMPEAREGTGVSYDASSDWSPPEGHSG